MINANELRIGNWYVNQWGEYLQVDADLFGADNLETYANPIPITAEILEKCGFVFGATSSTMWGIKDSDGDWLEFEGIFNGILEPYMYYTGANISQKAKPKHLHQLQNLYYSLTNEELIYKP